MPRAGIEPTTFRMVHGCSTYCAIGSKSEIPGSLVSEPKHRNTETNRLSVQDSSRSRNRTRNFKDLRTGIRIGIELFSILEPEPVWESDFEE